MDNPKRNGICAPEGRVFIPREQAFEFALISWSAMMNRGSTQRRLLAALLF